MVMRENTAALLMRQSMRPKVSSAACAMALVDASSATSVFTNRARPPWALTSASTLLPASALNSAITGIAPWAAKCLA
jgi:hypothetical protein